MEPNTTNLGGRPVRGRDLRYLLAHHLWSLPPGTSVKVADLVDALEGAGFDLGTRPTKVVSDALRWEIEHRRIVRLGWGRYAAGAIPRTARGRIIQRVSALHGAG